VLGTCGFHNWKKEHGRAEMGYELDSRMWRQGFMSEAVSAALEYGFGPMGLNRVEALVTEGNQRSRGFLEKAGFTLEGTLRQYEWARGRYQDQWMLSLLKEDRKGGQFTSVIDTPASL
jgi:ribosomal-protein-alanine N-acetyltransferase